MPEEHVDPEFLEALGGIVGGDGCAEVPHAGHHLGKVHDWRGGVDAEAGGVAHRVGGVGGGQQGLGGDAADVETIASEEVTFDQGGAGAEAGGGRGGDQTRGTTAEDDEIVASGWDRVLPVWRVDSGHEPSVGVIVGVQTEGHQGVRAHPMRRLRAERAMRVT